MARSWRYWGILSCLPLLAACASRAPAPVGEARTPTRMESAPLATAAAPAAAPLPAGRQYTIMRGDTLFSIALNHGLDHRELAAWNNIENPSRIQVGQQLRLDPPAHMAASPAVASVAEVRPFGDAGAPVSRPLDGQDAPAPGVLAPAPAPGGGERLKTAPKGGKLPYSEANLAALKAREAAPAPVAVPPAPAPAVVPPVQTPAPPSPATVEVGGIEWGWPVPGRIMAGFNENRAGQEVNKGIDLDGRIGDPVRAAAAGRVIYVGVFPKHGNLAVLLHSGGYSSVYAHNRRILVKEGQMVTRGQQIAELGDSDADRPKLHFEIRQQGKPLDPLGFLPPRP